VVSARRAWWQLAVATSFVLLLWLADLPPLSAQSRSTSAVRGLVVSTEGAPVAGAVIEMRHDDTGLGRSALTDERGQFLLLQLAPGGPYTLSVSHVAYSIERLGNIMLRVGVTHFVDVSLSLEAIEVEGIEVRVERAVVFDPNQVGPATRLSERVIESMPILSRDVMELATLSPLVTTTAGGGFSVAGVNDRYNAVLIDGIGNKDLFGVTAGGVPGGQAGAKLIPLDAVAQYEVLIAPFDVRLSGFTGGVLNAVTRTGTNDWRVTGGAVHRNEAFIGDLHLQTGPVEASGVDRSLFAFSAGGPIVRDELHVYLAAEFEQRRRPPSGFNLVRDDPSLIRLSPDSVARVASLFDSEFGVDLGEWAPYPLEQGLGNIFARVDWNPGGAHRMTARHVYARAVDDQEPNRSAFDPYELSSNAVFRSSTSNVTSVQLLSDLGPRLANELDVTFQRSADRTDPASEDPQIDVLLRNAIDGTAYSRELRFGGQYSAQVNDLEQTSLRLTNNLDRKYGDDILTLGVSAAWHDIQNAFLPGARGEWFFPSMADLVRNTPYRYQQAVLAEGEDEAIDFGVIEWGAFAQYKMHAGKGLTMHFGLRADVPHVLGRPAQNVELLDLFGYDTSRLPSGNVLFSPRFGFNWQSGGERNTQVRGGWGMFNGQIPYAWLSNAFHQNGLRSVTHVCEGRRTAEPHSTWPAPAFDGSATTVSCYDPLPNSDPWRVVRTAVVFEPDFRYPKDLKFAAAVDRELTDRVTGTLGALFSKSLDQVGFKELNIDVGAPDSEDMAVLGGLERRYYERRHEDYAQVLAVTNEGEDWGVSLSAELKGTLTDRLAFQLGYAMARSWDRTSLVSTDMLANFGLTATSGDVNKPPLRTSNFDRPHKFVATVYGAPFPGLPRTEVSLLYIGQSGLPFSYVYRGDVNGDGHPGLGPAFDRNNDLLFVPDSVSGQPMSFVTQLLMGVALNEDECLARYRGEQLNRNGCRAPWEHRLDLRLTHTVSLGHAELRLEADMINVLSLIAPELGRVERTASMIPLLELCQLGCGPEGPLPARWGGAVLPTRDEDGALRASDPWTVITPESQWQLQMGARLTFGGIRRR